MMTKRDPVPSADPSVTTSGMPSVEHSAGAESSAERDTLKLGGGAPSAGASAESAPGAEPASAPTAIESAAPGSSVADRDSDDPNAGLNPWKCQDIELPLDVRKQLIGTELPKTPTQELYLPQRDQGALSSDVPGQAEQPGASATPRTQVARQRSSGRLIAAAVLGALLVILLSVAVLSPRRAEPGPALADEQPAGEPPAEQATAEPQTPSNPRPIASTPAAPGEPRQAPALPSPSTGTPTAQGGEPPPETTARKSTPARPNRSKTPPAAREPGKPPSSSPAPPASSGRSVFDSPVLPPPD
jgi:hypothetical protein